MRLFGVPTLTGPRASGVQVNPTLAIASYMLYITLLGLTIPCTMVGVSNPSVEVRFANGLQSA